jgi:hypothetical protein
MNPFADRDLLVCKDCLATNPVQNDYCWVCQTPLNKTAPISLEDLQKRYYQPPVEEGISDQQLAIGTIVAIVLCGLLGVGLAHANSPWLMAHLLIVVPGVLFTAVRVWIRRALGKTVTPAQTILTFVFSALLSLAISVIVMVCLIIALFIACVNGLSGVR